MNERPLCVDLFCGLGGWAEGFLREGYRVVGFDNDPRFAKVYPGEFVLQDVRTLDGRRFRDARCIVASPPCQEFSSLRWMFRRQPWGLHTFPRTDLWSDAERIAREARVPIVIENVDGARKWVGPARTHRGSFYLWGDVPLLSPMALPPKEGRLRARHGWSDRRRGPDGAALRAKIPLPLARAVARGFL